MSHEMKQKSISYLQKKKRNYKIVQEAEINWTYYIKAII